MKKCREIGIINYIYLKIKKGKNLMKKIFVTLLTILVLNSVSFSGGGPIKSLLLIVRSSPRQESVRQTSDDIINKHVAEFLGGKEKTCSNCDTPYGMGIYCKKCAKPYFFEFPTSRKLMKKSFIFCNNAHSYKLAFPIIRRHAVQFGKASESTPRVLMHDYDPKKYAFYVDANDEHVVPKTYPTLVYTPLDAIPKIDEDTGVMSCGCSDCRISDVTSAILERCIIS